MSVEADKEALSENMPDRPRGRGRVSQGKILPLEIRDNLRKSIQGLGLAQRAIAKEANVSDSEVSRLLSGAKPVKDIGVVTRVVDTIARSASQAVDTGLNSEGQYRDNRYASCVKALEETRNFFGILDPMAVKLQELQVLSNRTVIESVTDIIGQSIKFSELAIDGLNVLPVNTPMVLTILRRSQEFNLAAQHILESSILRSQADENIRPS